MTRNTRIRAVFRLILMGDDTSDNVIQVNCVKNRRIVLAGVYMSPMSIWSKDTTKDVGCRTFDESETNAMVEQ